MADTKELKKTGGSNGGLAEAASASLVDVEQTDGAAQGTFEGTDYTKIKFVGVQYDTLDMSPKIGDEVTFGVKGRVKAVGDEELKDGHIRHVAKVEVHSVTPFVQEP